MRTVGSIKGCGLSGIRVFEKVWEPRRLMEAEGCHSFSLRVGPSSDNIPRMGHDKETAEFNYVAMLLGSAV